MGKQLLTEGNVFTTLIKFSLPFLFSNILQAAYGAADLLIVGQFADPSSISAVATGSQIMQTVTGLCIGLATGGTVVIGQHFGSGNKQGWLTAIQSILVLFALLSGLLTFGLVSFLSPLCTIMQTPTEAFESTKQYLFICSGGILFILGFNAVSAILRGFGDSKTPLLFVSIACFTNIAGDLLLVGKFQMGAVGAAIATVGAQAVSLLLSIVFLLLRRYWKKFWYQTVRFQVCSVQKILAIGLPIALQEGLINVSFLIITAIVNTMGVTASAAVGIVEKLIVFSMLPTTAFASSVSAMTAQHYGAGLLHRARSGLKYGIFLSVLLGLPFFLCSQWKGELLLRLFTADPDVIRAGVSYLRSYSLDCILVCFVFCMNAYFSGCGYSLFPLLHSLAATITLRIPVSYLFSHCLTPSMFAIGCAAPLATMLSLILCILYLFFLSKQQSKTRKKTLCM